jgi:putative PIN family toxin of toxin-antitoxin system
VRVVVDTNVLVSGLLHPHGPSGRIVDLLVRAELVALYDDRILAEYREVLSREKFGFDPADVAQLVDRVARRGEPFVAPPLPSVLADPTDQSFVDVAVAGRADALVTGNLRHFDSLPEGMGVRVFSPSGFVAQYARGWS